MRYWNTMTKAQQESCQRLYRHNVLANWKDKTHPSNESYLAFRRRFHECDGNKTIRNRVGSYFGGFIPSGIFIGIETDGHAHS